MNPIYKQINKIQGIDGNYLSRILFYDPTPIYNKWNVYVYARFQKYNPIENLFEIKENECSCGCGKVPDRKVGFRWNTNECRLFCESVIGIITGSVEHIKPVLKLTNKEWSCIECGSKNKIHVDHIIPIHKGGGGCWLNNYQVLCASCHNKKTAIEVSEWQSCHNSMKQGLMLARNGS